MTLRSYETRHGGRGRGALATALMAGLGRAPAGLGPPLEGSAPPLEGAGRPAEEGRSRPEKGGLGLPRGRRAGR
ncbi:hypothetical protein GCM10010510_09170 [Streptomyces anandii JCM 4720]|nr:hypothetical protein GCM10010510_09170 [Streptomyces anandii JCM 4720]